jgi:hypothetical protein
MSDQEQMAALLKDAGLSEEEIRATVDAFNPKALTALARGTMRQSDYSRNMDKLKTDRERIEARWAEANKHYQQMLADVEATEAEVTDAKAKLAEAEGKLEKMPDASQFLTPAQVEEKIAVAQREYALSQTAYFGEVLELQSEHQQLFGNRLSPQELIRKATEAKQNPRQYWEEAYKVADKRKEIAEAETATQRDKWKKEGYEEGVQAASKPPGARGLEDSRSPFYAPKEGEKQPWDDGAPTEAETKLLTELMGIGR